MFFFWYLLVSFFLLSLLAFFFVTYTFSHVSQTARYFSVLLYLKPVVSFITNFHVSLPKVALGAVPCFSNQFFCIYIWSVIKVSIFPFRFVCILFLFVICLSKFANSTFIYVFSFNLPLLLQSNIQHYIGVSFRPPWGAKNVVFIFCIQNVLNSWVMICSYRAPYPLLVLYTLTFTAVDNLDSK